MIRSIIGLAFATTLLGASAGQAQQAAQQGSAPMQVIAGRALGASPAVAALPPAAAAQIGRHAMPLGVRPPPPRPPGVPFADPALQRAYPPAAAARAVLTRPILDFAGLGVDLPGFSVCCTPPDTNAAVGTTQVVETVNVSFAVFSKSNGKKLSGPSDLSALYAGVGTNCENGFLSDPVVLFDHFHKRWVITFLAAADSSLDTPYDQCIAVSQSADATGKYFLYIYDVTNLPNASDVFNDYGKIGIWPDAYYMSFNEFSGSSGPDVGAAACAFPSASMIAGSAGSMICFGPIASEFGLLPSDADGRRPPHKGEPDFYIGSLDGSEHFNLWKFHVDFATPTKSTFTGQTTLQVAPYTEACIDQCIPQPAGGDFLEGLGDRLMFRAAYRNFRSHESIVVSHSVVVPAPTSNTVGIRWYEIRRPDATKPVIFQQGTFAPDASFRWMPSIAMDRRGDIALGYSVSDATSVFPSIRYTGRTPSRKAGTMTAESDIVAGAADLNDDGFDRWGDYSSMAIDPVDGCTFWYAQEYVSQSGTFNWSTRLASFRFRRCP